MATISSFTRELAGIAGCCRAPLFGGPVDAICTRPKQDLFTEPTAGARAGLRRLQTDSIEFHEFSSYNVPSKDQGSLIVNY